MNKVDAKTRNKRPLLLAVMLGTALATIGSGSATSAEVSDQALSSIQRYCSTCWRNAHVPLDRWDDCTQEVLKRLLERVPTRSWNQLLNQESEERREFLRAIDMVKKRHQRDRLRAGSAFDEIDDRRWNDGQDQCEEIDAVQRASEALLSERQQAIVQKTLEGATIADIAAAMHLPSERVSDEKYKAIQKLRGHFRQHPEFS